MTLSATRGLSDRPVADKDLPFFVNQQLIPYLKDLRNAIASLGGLADYTVSTIGDGAWTNLAAMTEFEANGTYQVEASIVTISQVGTKHAAYTATSVWKAEAGVATQIGTTTLFSEETDSAYDVRFSVSGLSVLVDVRDDAVSASNWLGRVSVVRLPL